MAYSLVDRYKPPAAIFRLEVMHINGDALELVTCAAIHCYSQIDHKQFHICTEVRYALRSVLYLCHCVC
jgi:hypothetical protein